MSDIPNPGPGPGEHENRPSELEIRKRNISSNIDRMTVNYKDPIEQNIDGVRSLSMPVTPTDTQLRGGGYESFTLFHTPPTEEYPTDTYAIDATKIDGTTLSLVYTTNPYGEEKWLMDHPEAEQDPEDVKEMGALLAQADDEELFKLEGEVGSPDMLEINLPEAREVDQVLSLALREIGVIPKRMPGDN